MGLLHGRGWVVTAVVAGRDFFEHPGMHFCQGFPLASYWSALQFVPGNVRQPVEKEIK
jgi:hypothetical protein